MSAIDREQIQGQLERLGVDSIDLWVLRGFHEKETSVEDTMAAVKVRCSAPMLPCLLTLVQARGALFVCMSCCSAALAGFQSPTAGVLYLSSPCHRNVVF